MILAVSRPQPLNGSKIEHLRLTVQELLFRIKNYHLMKAKFCLQKKRNISWKGIQLVFLVVLFFLAGMKNPYAQSNYSYQKSTIHIAIFAPLYLDSLFTGSKLKSESSIPTYAVAGFDFIQGAQIALDTLNLGGKHVQAFIYDSKSYTETIPWLIKNGKLNHVDLIIGSVKQPEYAQLAEFSLQRKIPFISATYPNDGGLRQNPFLIIANSTLRAHCQAIFSYILQKHSSDNIYLVKKKNENRIDNYFREINMQDGKSLLKIKTIIIDSSLTSNQFRYLIDTTKTSVIIGASLDQTFSQKLADACYPISKTNRLVLYGMPNWDGFPGWFKKGSYTDFPINYTTPHHIVKENGFDVYLSDKYLQLYRIRPNDMAEKGFEITYNFLSILLNHPGQFMENVNDTLSSPLHNFNFQPIYFSRYRSTDYYENKHLFMMQIVNGVIHREW